MKEMKAPGYLSEQCSLCYNLCAIITCLSKYEDTNAGADPGIYLDVNQPLQICSRTSDRTAKLGAAPIASNRAVGSK